MGKNSIRELLKEDPKRLRKVYTSHEGDSLIDELLEKGIPLQKVSKQKLREMVNSDSHQLFVAEIAEGEVSQLEDFFEGANLLLALDSITDPQNLGAILRAAECFGVDAVFWSRNRGCDITPVVAKASVGASELLKTFKVSNLAQAIERLQKEGFQIIIADVDPKAIPLTEFTPSEKIVLIMGSEGEGVRPLLKKLADTKVTLPMKGKIDSLNVSQATAVFLAYLTNSAKSHKRSP